MPMLSKLESVILDSVAETVSPETVKRERQSRTRRISQFIGLDISTGSLDLTAPCQ